MNLAITKKQARLSPFVPCILGFMVLLFLRDYIGTSIPNILFLVLVAFIALFADKTEVIAFCFCCTPMLNAFQSKYALLICIVTYLFRFSNKKIRVTPFIFPVIILMIWDIFHGFTGDFSPMETLRVFTEMLFICFVLCREKNELDFSKIIRSMSVVAVVVCLIILLGQLKTINYNIVALFSGVFRFGYAVDETRMSVGYNPNYLAYICLSCVEGLTFIFYKKQHNLFDLVMLAALSLFGMLTLSKKFIICAVFFVALFFISKKGNKLKSFLYIAVALVMIVALFRIIFPTAYENFILRFNEADMSTGRDSIMKKFNDLLWNQPEVLLFGTGLTGFTSILQGKYGIVGVPHNGFQEMIIVWGIFGFILFMAFLVGVIIRAKQINPEMTFVNFIPYLVMLLNASVSQLVSSSPSIMCLAIMYLCMSVNTKSLNNTYKQRNS